MSEESSSERKLLLAVVVSMFLWGLSWPSGKVLTQYLGPVNFIALRYFLVIASLLPVLYFLKIPLTGNRNGIPYIVISGSLLGFYSFLFYKGLKHGHAGAGGVLVTTLNPIMAYILGIFIRRKFPSKLEFSGMILGLTAGCILLKVWDDASSYIDSGNLYFLAAAFIWAVMSVFTSKAKIFGTSFTFSLWQYIITMICILPFVNYKEVISVFEIHEAVFWLNLFFTSVVVTTGATTVYFYTTTKLGPEKASSFIFLVPICAATSSLMLLNEPLQWHTIAGGLLGIAAVYMINRKK